MLMSKVYMGLCEPQAPTIPILPFTNDASSFLELRECYSAPANEVDFGNGREVLDVSDARFRIYG